MSIPLDQTYNYIDSLFDNNIIIYRFFPHGSKKLTDLTKLKSHCDLNDLLSFYTTPYMICHDQEPLNYALYQDPNLLEHDYDGAGRKHIFNFFTPQDWIDFKQNFGDMNLRIALNPWQHVFDKVILLHSEKNSKEVENYRPCGFEPAYWFSHASIARDWFRYAEIDPGFNKHADAKDFLIYNRAWSGTREYRLKLVELLIDNSIENCCLTSFQPWCDNNHYSKHTFVNPNFSIKNHDLESQFQPNTYDSTASADYVRHDYNSTHIEVVLETLFDDARWQLTEKIFRPIACGQPFILASTPGSLKYLQSYGFQTFDPWINESYDTIEHSQDRLTAIVHEMKRISSLDAVEKHKVLQHCNLIAEHNKNLFFSHKFLNIVLSELKQNITTALAQVTQTAQGTLFNKYLQFRKPHMQSHSWTEFSKQVLHWIESQPTNTKI